jgi:hypothetical protein
MNDECTQRCDSVHQLSPLANDDLVHFMHRRIVTSESPGLVSILASLKLTSSGRTSRLKMGRCRVLHRVDHCGFYLLKASRHLPDAIVNQHSRY